MAKSISTTALSRTSLAHSGGVCLTLFRHIDRIEALLAQSLALDQPSLGKLGARFERIVRIFCLGYIEHVVRPPEPKF
jgi:hypothetical protein